MNSSSLIEIYVDIDYFEYNPYWVSGVPTGSQLNLRIWSEVFVIVKIISLFSPRSTSPNDRTSVAEQITCWMFYPTFNYKIRSIANFSTESED